MSVSWCALFAGDHSADRGRRRRLFWRCSNMWLRRTLLVEMMIS